MDVNMEPCMELYLACQRGDLAKAEQLLNQRGVDVDESAFFFIIGIRSVKATPLLMACLCGNEKVAHLLASFGADVASAFAAISCVPRHTNLVLASLRHWLEISTGWSPLHHASFAGLVGRARQLLIEGADEQMCTKPEQVTPLQLAILPIGQSCELLDLTSAELNGARGVCSKWDRGRCTITLDGGRQVSIKACNQRALICPGQIVELFELTSKELNGARGVCGDSVGGRWLVKLDNGGRQVSIKPSNLRPYAPSPMLQLLQRSVLPWRPQEQALHPPVLRGQALVLMLVHRRLVRSTALPVLPRAVWVLVVGFVVRRCELQAVRALGFSNRNTP
jgi:hypothetical protein